MHICDWIDREGFGAQRRLAAKAGLHYQHVNQLLKGRYIDPRISTLRKIWEASDGEIDDISYRPGWKYTATSKRRRKDAG